MATASLYRHHDRAGPDALQRAFVTLAGILEPVVRQGGALCILSACSPKRRIFCPSSPPPSSRIAQCWQAVQLLHYMLVTACPSTSTSSPGTSLTLPPSFGLCRQRQPRSSR